MALVLDLLWAQVRDALYVTKDVWLRDMAEWEITPHLVDGKLVGVVLVKGAELHFATFDVRWHMTRADLVHYLQPVIDAHGFVRTRTPKDATRQHRFNKILGFVQDGEDEFDIHFRLDGDVFRRTICRS